MMSGQDVSEAMEKMWKEDREHLEVGCPHLAQVSDWAWASWEVAKAAQILARDGA